MQLISLPSSLLSLDLPSLMPRLGQLGQRLRVRDVKSIQFWGEVLASALSSKSNAIVSKLFHLQTIMFFNSISDLCIYPSNDPKLGRT